MQQQLLSATPGAPASLPPTVYLRQGFQQGNFTQATAPPASVYAADTNPNLKPSPDPDH